MIKLYTIGFTGKSAQQFFDLLEQNGVKKIIDTRINNTSQLSGFAKGRDLAFFARRLANIGYEHRLEFAPTKALLSGYRKREIAWADYTDIYLNLLEERQIKESINLAALHQSCLLCSEHAPDHCHRRLLAEYLQEIDPNIHVIHLQ